MRRVLIGLGVLLASVAAAEAKIAISVDKDAQQMTVVVDGVTRYVWPVSSGNPSHETPNGSFRAFRMEEDHYSKEFDEAPMPHSIFFTKQGHAIHGTDQVNRLGSPASHGCVRLSRANAATLFAMVKADGVLNTTVSLTGSSQVALARNPRGSKVAKRRPAEEVAVDEDAAGPVDLGRPGRSLYPQRVAPRAQLDDGYVYPAEGSDGRYPAPRGYRRSYEAQSAPGYAQPYGESYAAPRTYGPPVFYQRGY
jgi:hypothetical protein